MEQRALPIGLFNGTVATTNGLYRISDISFDSASELVRQHGFVSAVGHDAAAELMSSRLGVPVPMNRIQFKQQVGQLAIALKLNQRPNEGAILTCEQMESIGYTFKLVERIE
ncbi:MAG: YddF family protein [Bacteroidales bacterium]|nr:YddF family protein [Bacteroidales bacterium]MBN2750063.1 YddF family protein [Bacteroidales bacterium]